MPSADAVARLPRLVDDVVWCSTLHIPRQSLALLLIENLTKHHSPRVAVIEMGDNLQATIADGMEWQYRCIEVDEVGLIAIDGIERTIVEISDELLRGNSGPVCPVPLLVDGSIPPGPLAHGMLLLVELLRVEAFPPFALAIFLGEMTIVVDARFRAVQVVALRRFIPRPCMIGVEGDAQRQASLLRCLRPLIEDIALRTDVLRVSGLILRVPEVVVVVVIAQHEEILCTTTLVACDEFVGIPFLCLEERQHILEAELRGMAVVLDVVFILTRTFHIQRAGHPVAGAFYALRPPVGPDAELRIAKPLGRLMLAERLPCRLILARLHRLVSLRHGHLVLLRRGRQAQGEKQGCDG